MRAALRAPAGVGADTGGCSESCCVVYRGAAVGLLQGLLRDLRGVGLPWGCC